VVEVGEAAAFPRRICIKESDSGERNFFHNEIPLAGRTSHSDICSPAPAVIFMMIFDRDSIYRSIRWENINNLSEFLISFWCMKA
jgi:hypothetical protein